MQDVLTWGALVLASGSIVTVIKFWIDIGRTQQRADDGVEAARLAAAKCDLLVSALNEFKVESARTYATGRSLAEAEAQLARAFEQSMSGVYSRLDSLNSRIDSLINLHKPPAH